MVRLKAVDQEERVVTKAAAAARARRMLPSTRPSKKPLGGPGRHRAMTQQKAA